MVIRTRGSRPRKDHHNTPKNVWVSSEAEGRNTQDRCRTTPKINGAKNSMASFTGSGDNCRFLHSWFRKDGFTMMAKLDGHKKVYNLSFIFDKVLQFTVCWIALPLGSDKLYSGSRDGTARVWDCHTGMEILNHQLILALKDRLVKSIA
ncbi:hypothetical protein Q3G72_021256 [Acer saccharum]|nr:hypothetical protein Q3G72_021256 [Acer saccharum]